MCVCVSLLHHVKAIGQSEGHLCWSGAALVVVVVHDEKGKLKFGTPGEMCITVVAKLLHSLYNYNYC